MNELDLAYAAGLIDGEGTIYVGKSSGRHQLHVGVHMTTFGIPSWFKVMFGGSLSKHKGYKEHASDTYRWGVSDRKALAFLQVVLPYLKLKVPQANLGIQFQSAKKWGGEPRWRPVTPEEYQRREQIRFQMKALNKRGVP